MKVYVVMRDDYGDLTPEKAFVVEREAYAFIREDSVQRVGYAYEVDLVSGVRSVPDAERGGVDVTWVSRGGLQQMLNSDAGPSPKLRAAVERAREKRTNRGEG